MDDGGVTASFVLFAIVLLFDIMYYGFGSAIRNLNIKDFEKETEENKDIKSRYILNILQDPTSFVNTSQVIVSLSHIILGSYFFLNWKSFFLELVSDLLQNHTAMVQGTIYELIDVMIGVLTMIMILILLLSVGILVPKRAANRYPLFWAKLFVMPIVFFQKCLFPITSFVNGISKGILFIFGIRDDNNTVDVTEEEIISMVNEGHEQGVILASEAEMINNIFEYGEKEAQDIMTPRKNIVAIDSDISLEEAIEMMLDGKNSRYPVYEENLDHVVGVLNLKDAVRVNRKYRNGTQKLKNIKNLLRKVEVIPETRKIDVLLHHMQANKTQLVVVIDEYGQTSGLITMEDILEEIVGNIMDEYDIEDCHIKEKSETEFIIDGMTTLEELEERFLISFEEEEFETLNGFLISKMDKIPEENEVFDINVGEYNFKILSVDNKMIKNVLVTKQISENKEE